MITVDNKGSWHTKSYKPRYISLHPDLAEMLKDWPRALHDDKVFRGDEYSYKRFKRFCREAGMPDATCRWFRHTFGAT